MKRALIAALALGVSFAAGPAAFAGALTGFEVQKEMTAKTKTGRTMPVKIGTMDGKTYVVVPMEDFDDLYFRAEGHSMATGP